MRTKSSEFDFNLPAERIAQRPRPYDEQRLLVYERTSGHINHTYFKALPTLLRKGDLLVVNNSKVVPAALRQKNGAFVLFTDPMSSSFTNIKVICPWKPAVGERLIFSEAVFVVKAHEPGWDIYIGDLIPSGEFSTLREFLEVHGDVPIPTYVNRPPEPEDAVDFQTIFAKYAGSIAAPTAGLHFSEDLMSQIRDSGIEIAEITLHVGYGTFRSFKTEYVDEHEMDSEEYHISYKAIQVIGRALKEKRRVIAVGTTSTRVLESVAEDLTDFENIQEDLHGETRIFIYPPYNFKVISGLITNFHYPKIPVLSLTAAFCGLDELHKIYDIALERDYLFYSYGDAMLVI